MIDDKDYKPIRLGLNHENPNLATQVRIEIDIDWLASQEYGDAILLGRMEQIKGDVFNMLAKRIRAIDQSRSKVILPTVH